MTIRIFPEVVQGSDEWFAMRCGLLTASEMDRIITAKTLKAAANEKERTHLYELLAQRINNHVEPSYISDAMLRGRDDEIYARELYSATYEPVTEVGFVTNDRLGFTIGYSPDGLVGEHGQIEGKSRCQKYQVQTIVEHVGVDEGKTIPSDFVIQVQTGLIVTERQWCDLISFCGGMPMATLRVYPIPEVQNAIIEVAGDFEKRLEEKRKIYLDALASTARLIPTERRDYGDIVI